MVRRRTAAIIGMLMCLASLGVVAREAAAAEAAASTTQALPTSAIGIALPGALGDVTFPSASRPGNVVLTSTLGAFPDAAVPPNDNAPAAQAAPAKVFESVRLTFDRDIDFSGYPTFALAMRPEVPESTYLVELFDESSATRIAVYPSTERSPTAYVGGYSETFHARAGHVYDAQLVLGPYVAKYDIFSSPQTIATSAYAGGIRAIFDLPGSQGERPGSTLLLVPSTHVPVGVPPLSGPFVDSAPYFVDAVFTGFTQTYSGTFGVTFVLPRGSLPLAADYGLAVYDPGWSTRGWQILGIAPTTSGTDQLRFTIPAVSLAVSFRHYALALFVKKKAMRTASLLTPALPAEADRRFTVAFLGASESRLVQLPGDPVACYGTLGPAPDCRFVSDPSADIPGVLATKSGARVINLSMLSAQTLLDTYLGPSMLSEQVPQIPTDADVVVLNLGYIDIGWAKADPAAAAHVPVFTEAVHARAPHARIVFVGLRCYARCNPVAVEAWNIAEKAEAKKYGVWFDLQHYAAAQTSPEFPDGTHPSLAAAQAIGTDLAALITGWMHPQ